jgi:hypothetical protein
VPNGEEASRGCLLGRPSWCGVLACSASICLDCLLDRHYLFSDESESYVISRYDNVEMNLLASAANCLELVLLCGN